MKQTEEAVIDKNIDITHLRLAIDNKRRFLAGEPFMIVNADPYTLYTLHTYAECGGYRIDARLTRCKNDSEYHCSVDAITKSGVRVFKTLLGKVVERFVKFKDMNFNV